MGGGGSKFLSFNIFGGFQKNIKKKWGMKTLWIFFGGNHKLGPYLVVISMHFSVFWFKHILLARTVDIIKQMLTILKLQGLEWKQHAYIIPFLITNNIL